MNENTNLTPRKIVEYLDQYIIGQSDAKRSVAVALRNAGVPAASRRKWRKR
mgnify:CR=1 FL=1